MSAQIFPDPIREAWYRGLDPETLMKVVLIKKTRNDTKLTGKKRSKILNDTL